MQQSVIAEQTVLNEVKKAIVEAIEANESDVTPSSSLVKDLGAESLDFLDINYRLEQAFGIKMARHTILEHVEETFGEESAINAHGQLTENAVKLLRTRFTDNHQELRAGMEMDEVPGIVTVQSMVDGVMDILNTLPEKCASCGNSAWQLNGETRVQCGSCGQYATFRDGDELIKEWLVQVQEEHRIF